jgi:hypothetical protein
VTENEIRRIPEVYGGDKVKEDVGRASLHSIQRVFAMLQVPVGASMGGIENEGGRSMRKVSKSLIANSF